MRILLTGGAGFVGSHLADALIEETYLNEITIVDNLSNGTMDNLKHLDGNSYTFMKEDISTYIPREDYDIIYHLACFPRSMCFDNPARDVEVNVKGMVNVLECARRCGALVVFSSNSGICNTDIVPITEDSSYDDPKSPYDLDKLTAEWYGKIYKDLYDVDTIIFRFGTVYGPRQQVSDDWKPVVMTFLQNATNNKPCEIHGDGEQTRDFIYISDIIKALLVAKSYVRDIVLDKHMVEEGYVLVNEGEVFNKVMILGTGVETSINKLYKLVEEVSGNKLSIVNKPANIGDIRRMCYPSDRAREILGWKPVIDVKTGAELIVKWLERENRCD